MLLPLGRAIVPCMSQQSLAIRPFTAQMAEQVCKALADAVTGSQIPGLIAFLKVAEGPGQAQGTKWVRLYNAVAARQNIQHDGRPLIRLVSEVMTPVRFASQAEFDSARARVNQRLLLAGFEVLESGKVGKAARLRPSARHANVPTISARNLPAATFTRMCSGSAVPSWCSRTTSMPSSKPPRASPTSCGH